MPVTASSTQCMRALRDRRRTWRSALRTEHGWGGFAESALRGSSYLTLPAILQFFTGNIGLHRVHHLSPRIPNYNLQRAHADNRIFQDVPTLTLWVGIRVLRLKLYDEDPWATRELLGRTRRGGDRQPRDRRTAHALPLAGEPLMDSRTATTASAPRGAPLLGAQYG